MLFVWPDENGWEKAAATNPPMYVTFQDQKKDSIFDIMRRNYH